MNRRDRNYWIEQAKDKVLERERQTDSYVKELMFLYDEAANQIENEVGSMFAKYATDNRLSSVEASRLLSGQEYSVWRKSIEQYVQEASSRGRDSKTLLELNTLAMKSRISRKEQLLGNIYKEMAQLAEESSTKLETILSGMFKTSYLRSEFDLQRGLGIGWSVSKLDDKLIRQTISYPWSQKHFSRAVWDDTDKVAALAKREITLGFIKGSNPKEMARNIDRVMGKGRYAAERLARTECKYFAVQGELTAYQENGIKRYRFIGSPENGSCGCAALNGKEFDLEEAVAGVNLPPIHPNCLCTIVAAFKMSLFDDNRNVTPLKENVKFREWKKKYAAQVDTGPRRGIMKELELRNIPITEQAIDRTPDVRLRTLSKKQSKLFSERQRELLRFVKDAPVGKEAICYCDLDMRILTRYIGSGNNQVKQTKLDVPHVCIHNHPSGTTFTFADISLLLRAPAMRALSAVGNDGKVFLLEKAKNYSPGAANLTLNQFLARNPEITESPEKYLAAVEKFLKEAEKGGLSYTRYNSRK